MATKAEAQSRTVAAIAAGRRWEEAMGSVDGRVRAEGDAADEVIRAVRAERVHERPRADVAIGARQRVTAPVARAARDRQRAVDDATGGVVGEGLGRLGFGEEHRDRRAVA